ncbi:MAG: porin family protein [Prevotellaceae bacterium]|nr:porin family protein [Prevotellaceae bacterium]
MLHRFIILLVGGMLCGLTSLQAQRLTYLIQRDSVAERDTIVFGELMLQDSPVARQYTVTLLSADRKQTYTPHDLVGYYDGRVLRLSKSLLVDGRAQQLFVEEGENIGDAFFFFKYLNPQGAVEYYYQKAPSGEGDAPPLLLPVKGEGDEVFAAELTDYLKQYPAFQNKRTQTYIRHSVPTDKRYRSLYRITKNQPPTFRWGVTVEGGMLYIEDSSYPTDKMLWHGLFGLFAEWQIINGFSVRPELTYRSSSYTDGRLIYYKYKRQDLTPTLLLRYTEISTKGKWLPYAQAGIDYNLTLSGHSEVWATGISDLEREDHNKRAKAHTVSWVVGAGVEYKLNLRHSFFFDLRYRRELSTLSRSGLYISVSYNL